jgi:hypothetical protein
MKQRFLQAMSVVSVVSALVFLALAVLQLLAIRQRNRMLYGAWRA